MGKKSPRVDEYIAESPSFARPILRKIRRLFHKASAEIEENIKWNSPTFEHKGIVAGMAAFKKHVSYGFFKSKLLKDPQGLFKNDACESIFLVKVTTTSDLPPDQVLIDYMKEAVAINEQGGKPHRTTGKKKTTTIKAPADLATALRQKKHLKAKMTFDNLSPSNKKEYIEWLTEAKREETREKRLATTLEWLAEGKPRNWKYMKKW